MSHSVTVTRTITTSTTSGIIINTGYMRTWPGLLKLFQTLLGIVVVGIVSYYYGYYTKSVYIPELFMLLMSVTFLVGTFLLLLSCLISLSTASIISKTIFEVIYHGAAFVMYLAASITFLAELNNRKSYYRNHYDAYMAAAIIGLIVSVLYLLSTIFASRTYRGI